ncbi:FtsK/SpoIIIE domain-containing protein [Pannus brasiliensis CCIBt3594]|uniref:FtsK/SpoIIIE domain-containing protein n=1 Tax=Pannus brasiliensis CCIBt3594 TaxID=1427578 RepID=A0AAW9QRS5_9CHRO
MRSIDLIGQVATKFLRKSLNLEDSDGVARFLLDRLTGEQVTNICQSILVTPDLSPRIKIQIPRALVEGYNLPEAILTDEKTVHLRHAPCDRPCLLLANTNDDQGQSLKDIFPLGAGLLKEKIEFWVEVASEGLDLPEEQLKYWQKALKGLQSASECSLEQFANYVMDTRERIASESVPIINALGWALPALRLPRDSGYFEAIPEKEWGHAQKWQQKYQQAISKRGCLLIKQTPTRKAIEESELQSAFEKVKDEIPSLAYSTVEAFIKSAPEWNESARALTYFEWETDNINSLFLGLKSKKTDLYSLTKQFYEDEYPNSLTEADIEYLETLKKRGTKEANEEDKEFYDTHRSELENDRSLKTKWDKFVYGQPIECTDFLVGLLQAFERLFDQNDSQNTHSQLIVSTQKSSRKSNWLELNADIGLYFCTRYRGIEQLTQPEIIWKTHCLFEYDELLKNEQTKNKKKYKKNVSVAKTATELKFYVELRSRSSQELIGKTQLIWKGNPNAIGMELHDDLERLINPQNSPFVLSQVSRELVSKKGRLQGISLEDVGTLMAAYRQDRGSLVSKYEPKQDLAKQFPNALKEAVKDNRLSSDSAELIKQAWEKFQEVYQKALNSLLGLEGISSPYLLEQCDTYQKLIKTLLNHGLGDINRVKLIEPILRLGCVRVERGKPAAIIPPWHPLRLASLGIKARQISGLLKHILSTEEVNFGDSRLFFSDLRNELLHPYYPEVCLGYKGNEPLLLSLSDTVNDYSLLEQPVRDTTQNSTNDDPKVAATKLLDLIKRYLELLPHKKNNLSIVLYQCDSTRLPQKIITQFSELQDDYNEARCQVILYHRDSKKLSGLYEQLLESSETDSDAFIANEASRDFMARLRISIMSNALLSSTEKVADIVFLQDIISRQAEIVWQPTPLSDDNPDILKHVPSRWSKKRPATKDELKSTVYLVCPSQPVVGQTYLDAIYSSLKREDCSDNHFLPALQISFQDEDTCTVFKEVHRLGEWVVNYDSLLERRQLMNQGVNVIRYQQTRTDDPNLLVSSNAPFNLLQVLVKCRLEALNLGLDEITLNTLAEGFINEANGISGDIVLKAAQSGKYASELMGVVLSKALLSSELGNNNPIGWYFLDDYATWLGQKEGRIADILAISPQIKDEQPVLKLIISEAKYIEASGLNDARKNSQHQLRDTVERMTNALFVSPGRLDRDLWLSRLGDLLLDGIEFNSIDPISIEQWRKGVKNGTIKIDILGYSHVFISGPSDSSVNNDQIPIAKVDRCYQEIFSRDAVRQLVLAIHQKRPLAPIREQLGHEQPWTISNPRFPASRVVWVSPILESPIIDNSSSSKSSEKSLQNIPQKGKINEESYTLSKESITSNHHVETINATQKSENIHDDSLSSSSTISTHVIETEHRSVNHIAQLAWASPALAIWIDRTTQSQIANTEAEQWLVQTVSVLRKALISYDLQAKVLGQRLTPNVALIRFQGSDRLNIKDVENRRSQLLTTHGLNVINVSGIPGEIIISVARPSREIISLSQVWKQRKINLKSGVNLSLVIGVKEIDGELLYLNLGGDFAHRQQHAPHTLIAGATGSGKSILLRNLLLDVCATNSPDSVKIYLIDAKQGTDYFPLEDLPHLTQGIITEQEQAIEIFDNIVKEMDSRYQAFRDKKVNNLFAYNQKVTTNEKFPVLFLVHDEFADWMLVDEYKEAVSSAVQRLGVKARAAGIHLIFAAQRPDSNVFPMQLRDNLGNRLILRVESVGTSEISLGQKGAESLLGRGHLVARLSGESDIIYAQIPFLSDEEFPLVANAIKQDLSQNS